MHGTSGDKEDINSKGKHKLIGFKLIYGSIWDMELVIIVCEL